MTTIRLLPKQQIRIDGTVYEVVRRTGDGDISLQDVQTLAPCALSDDQVATLFLEGSLAFVEPGEEVEEGFNPRIADFSQLPVNLKEEARRREAYVRPVRQRCLPHSAAYLKPLISEVAAKLEDPNPPSVATLCRWLQRWKNSGERDVRALVPNYFGRGNRTRRLPHQVLQIINEAVDIVYLQPEGTTIRAAWSKAVADIHRINQGRPENTALPMPSERTIGKRIAAIDRYDRMRARSGRRMADHEYLPVGAGPRASRPLEVVEADHTQMDIILLSKDGVVLGRPWLTAIMNVSRVYQACAECPIQATALVGGECACLVDERVIEASKRLYKVTNAKAVILFGSRARGDASSSSDWDLCVILPDDVDPQQFTPSKLWKIVSDLKAGVQVYPIRQSVFESEKQNVNSVSHDINRDGVVLVGTLQVIRP